MGMPTLPHPRKVSHIRCGNGLWHTSSDSRRFRVSFGWSCCRCWTLISNLRYKIVKLRHIPVLRHGDAVSHVPNNIDVCRGLLHLFYDGPYHVIERLDKTFLLDIGGRLETFSIDRLKYADPDRPGTTTETRPYTGSWNTIRHTFW